MPYDNNDRFDRPNSNEFHGSGGRRNDRGGDRPYGRFDNQRGGYRDQGGYQPRDGRGYGNERYDRNDRSYDGDRRYESVFSTKMRAGKRRTYFFDVLKTKGNDFYLTITESTKRPDESFSRHKIFLYKEDFNRFVEALNGAVDHIKTNLLPEYDYDEFARRYDDEEGGEGGDYMSSRRSHFAQPVEAQFPSSDVADSEEDFEESYDDEDFEEEDEESEVDQPQPPAKPTALDEDEDGDMKW